MRTSTEMLTYIADNKDLFGTVTADLFDYFDLDSALTLMTDKAKESYADGTETWVPAEQNRQLIIKKMRDYMDFAIGKARDRRGLSATRSIIHFRTWMWLLGDEDKVDLHDGDYEPYGIPMLKAICVEYDFPQAAEM